MLKRFCDKCGAEITQEDTVKMINDHEVSINIYIRGKTDVDINPDEDLPPEWQGWHGRSIDLCEKCDAKIDEMVLNFLKEGVNYNG